LKIIKNAHHGMIPLVWYHDWYKEVQEIFSLWVVTVGLICVKNAVRTHGMNEDYQGVIT